MFDNENTSDIVTISNEFKKIINEFMNDLIRTFPDKITEENNKDFFILYNGINCEDIEERERNYNELYNHCKEVYPVSFFNILYEKEDIFSNEGKIGFIPGINFVELWTEDLSDTIKSTIWKYLQLLLFTVITDVNSDKSFGDAAKLFEAINADEFKKKIEDTIGEMENIFKKNMTAEEDEDISNNTEGIDEMEMPNEDISMGIPNAEALHDHISKMMDGKLGCLAREIAEETADDLNIDVENISSVNDVFNKLFKNPTKLMDLVKNVGSKLDNKLKTGDIKETELLEEASEFVNNMKNMPGMGNLESMFSKMGIPGMGQGAKVDMNAFNRQMQQNMRVAKMKERMRTKLEKNKTSETSQNESSIISKGINSDGLEELIFSSGDVCEKSERTGNNKKKKKGKGKKK